MPRKVQYSREMIIEAAIEMIRAKGVDSVNARDLGEWLGCSSRPLFTAFRNMEELMDAVREEVSNQFLDLLRTVRDMQTPVPTAKRIGTRIVQYAQEEPNLFKFIHWTGKMIDVEQLKEIMATQYMKDYDLNEDDAMAFFERMMIFNLGLCSLITSGVRQFTKEELERILLEQFSATLAYYKNGKQNIKE